MHAGAFCAWYVVPCGAESLHAEFRAARHAVVVFEPHALTTTSPHSAFARAVQKSARVAYDVGSVPPPGPPGAVSAAPAAQPRVRVRTRAQNEEGSEGLRMGDRDLREIAKEWPPTSVSAHPQWLMAVARGQRRPSLRS